MAKYFPENITQFICHQLCLTVAHDSLSVKEFTCCKNPGTLYKVREQTRPECSHGAASSFFTLPQACRGVHSGSVKCAKDWVRFRIVDCNIIIRIVERMLWARRLFRDIGEHGRTSNIKSSQSYSWK